MKTPNQSTDSLMRPIAFVVIGFLLVLQVHLLIVAIPQLSLGGQVDFSAFYCVGKILDSGAGHHLYERGTQDACLASLPARFDKTFYFYHPPFEAPLFMSFGLLSYDHAFIASMIVNLALLLIGTWAIGLNPLIALAFYPVAFGLYVGQDSFLLFALIAFAYRQFRAGKDVMTGILLGLCLFKFQIAVPIAVALMLMLRMRAVKFAAGFAATAAAVIAASWALVGTSGVGLYRLMMARDLVEHFERMANIRGIVGSLGGGLVVTLILSAAIMLLPVFLPQMRGENMQTYRTTVFCVAILAATLVSYHMHGYDLVLLLIPIGEAFRKGFGSAGAWCAAIFFVPIVATPLYLLAINNGFAYLFAVPILALLVSTAFQNRRFPIMITSTMLPSLAQVGGVESSVRSK